MSDNGGLGGYGSEGIASPFDFTNAIPLRSGKGSLFEGGVRVPLIVRLDREASGGRVVDQRVQHVDLYPTLAELTGAPLDAAHVLDGESLVPRLQAVEQSIDRDSVFLHFPAYEDYPDVYTELWRAEPCTVAWSDTHKLTFVYSTRTWTLYDLQTDIGETIDLAADLPDVVLDLGTQMVDWLVASGADLPFERNTGLVAALPDPSL